MESNECLQVFVRCRPLLESEMQQPIPVEVHAEVNKIIVRDVGCNKNAVKAYSFDKVFGPEAGQALVYNNVAAPLIQEVLMGFNCTILAYGQTGTGKTFTIEGDRNAALNNTTEGSVTVQGLEMRKVKSMQDVYDVLEKGCKKRRKAATLLNKMSSRSHTVFTVVVKMREHSSTIEKTKIGKLNLVDLAGSENIGRSGAVEKRAREAGNINQSLLALGRVITALCENAIHIPYRESKLTRLLRDSLGGQTKTTVIATISPSIFHLDETLNTLEYALRAKNIMNKPEVNAQVSATALTKEYLGKICALEREIKELSSKGNFQVHPDNLKYLDTALQTKSREIREELEMKEKLMAESLELDEAILKATETLRLKELEWKKCISDQEEIAERLTKEQKEIQIEERELHILRPVKAKLHEKLHKVTKEYEEIKNEVKKMEERTSEVVNENSRLRKQYSSMCRAQRNFNEALLQFKNRLMNCINEIQKNIVCEKTECDKYLSSLNGGFDSFTDSAEKLNHQFENVINDVEKLKSNLHEALKEALRNEEIKAKERRSDIESSASTLIPCNFESLQPLLTNCEENLRNLFQSLTHWRDTLMQKLTRQENQLNIYLSSEDQHLSELRDSCKDVTKKQEEFIHEYNELISGALSSENERKKKFDEKISVLEEAVEQMQKIFTEMLDDDIEKSILAHDIFREHAEGEMRNVESLITFCESSMKSTESFKEETSFTSNETLKEKMEDMRGSANNAIANFKELLSEFTNCVQQTKLSDESITALEQRILDDKSRRTEMPSITSSIQNFKENLMEKDQYISTLYSEHETELKTIETNEVAALKEAQDAFNHLHVTFTEGVSRNISSIETSDTSGFSWNEDIIKDDDPETTLLSAEDNSSREGTSVLDVTFTLSQENINNENETGCKFCKNKDDTIAPQPLSTSISKAKPSKSNTSKTSKYRKNKKEATYSDLVEKWCQELFTEDMNDESSESDRPNNTS
ncbi:kinesin-like protein KIF11 isoform X2 [Argiope bruennichi]|uniref:kinesin-like protein KIF11 isoform X2 n=1 Tax=Argiope bruennichi TaxID=94029 RepID=UPI002494089E|nr:kinesin-like protein KIF11 isoform X2 [Argiope bruennichi]